MCYNGCMNSKTVLDEVLSGLMKRYRSRVPDVGQVLDAMLANKLIRAEEEIENDHIAFRTMGVNNLGIASLEKIFLSCGYEKRDYYRFEAKKLNAYWYSPPEPCYPRVFISELCVEELSKEAQNIITSYTGEVSEDPVESIDLSSGDEIDEFLHSPLWRTPTWSDFQTLLEESEYASWVIYNRYYLNHFTISVHNLGDGYNTMAEFVGFLERNGIKLNDAGGKIKESPDGLLLQSSTVAEKVSASFATSDGEGESHDISGSYVEFAERRVLEDYKDLDPNQVGRKHRRDGFEAANADRIFESTYRSQTDKSD